MHDKIAVIIGGSSGIGAATARLLAARGATVIIGAPLPQSDLETISEDLSKDGSRIYAFPADVRSRSSIQSLFKLVKSTYGRVDIVINSAGVFRTTPIFEPDFNDIDTIIDTNMVGSINVVISAIAAMRETGGSIVMVTSTQAVKGEPNCSVYAATKAGVAHFVASITPELTNSNIRAVCVAPGGTRTPMTAASYESRDVAVQERLDRTRGGAYGSLYLEPEQVAEVIAFAASDAAGAIQGCSLIADQGYSSAIPPH